jgi:hypothetical protein
MMKIIAAVPIVAAAVFVLSLLSILATRGNCALETGQPDFDGSTVACLNGHLATSEYGMIANTSVISKSTYEHWTNLSIFLLDSERYCYHLTYFEGDVLAAQNYLNKYSDATVKYVFTTTFTSSKDNACNPDVASLFSQRIGAILLATFSGVASFVGWFSFFALVCPDEAKSPKPTISYSFWRKVLWLEACCLLFTVALYLASTLTHCSFKQCYIMPAAIPFQPVTGVLQNVTQDSLVFSLPANSNLSPQNNCTEFISANGANGLVLGASYSILLNPSTKSECRRVPHQWNTNWYWMLSITAAGFVLFFVGLYRVSRLRCTLIYAKEEDADTPINYSSMNSSPSAPLIEGS